MEGQDRTTARLPIGSACVTACWRESYARVCAACVPGEGRDRTRAGEGYTGGNARGRYNVAPHENLFLNSEEQTTRSCLSFPFSVVE
jgi:hypothetical protein